MQSATATPDDHTVALRLPAAPTACADARRAVRDLCHLKSLDRITDDAQLLTSELVSNAVRYSTDQVTVRASSAVDGLTVTVTDDGQVPTAPNALRRSPASLPTVTSEQGRGLYLVDRLAADWGSGEHTVWFRLA
ncbi:MAG: hypothetical protein QOJ92_1427 [Frankiales bacterium]|jgi:anti-sigma regulatory factor (Ser/Thr protein kinase)|nr:hypothetical protein [Frankiales bacterium]MDX6274217.1 hypothetical protein [Frankiales bacterium]